MPAFTCSVNNQHDFKGWVKINVSRYMIKFDFDSPVEKWFLRACSDRQFKITFLTFVLCLSCGCTRRCVPLSFAINCRQTTIENPVAGTSNTSDRTQSLKPVQNLDIKRVKTAKRKLLRNHTMIFHGYSHFKPNTLYNCIGWDVKLSSLTQFVNKTVQNTAIFLSQGFRLCKNV